MASEHTRPANCDKCGRFVGTDGWCSTDPETGYTDEVLCGRCRDDFRPRPKDDGLPEQTRYEDLTESDLDTLRHMLGWQRRDQKEPLDGRNSYCAEPGDEDLTRLEQLGLVQCTRRAGLPGIFQEYDCFVATELGKAMARKSFYQRREGKAKRVYSAWLTVADVWPDWTFGDFLKSTHPDVVAVRRNA